MKQNRREKLYNDTIRLGGLLIRQPFARRYARANGRAVITAGRALARANQRLEQTLRWGASAPLALLNRAPVRRL